MLLTLVIILILIWSAVVGSLYSNFLVFYQNFSEAENYHKSYYASVAAIERAELVIKQRQPWFEWSWWWIWGNNTSGSPSDNKPNTNTFSYISDSTPTLHRSIKSRTNRIPAEWKGNVEKLLSTWDSVDYNMMDYENAEIFLLYYDKKTGKPYDKKHCPWDDCQPSKMDSLTGYIRLPWYIRPVFHDLNIFSGASPELTTGNDAIVDWQLRWVVYSGAPEGRLSGSFTIFATQKIGWNNRAPEDSAIRESDLNQNSWIVLKYNDKSRNPRNNDYHGSWITVVSRFDDEILGLTRPPKYFKWILNDNSDKYKELQLRFSLLNLVEWLSGTSARYPFLEYYVEFWDTVSDKYFTIETESNIGEYRINTIRFKPTITESVLRNFTTIL